MSARWVLWLLLTASMALIASMPAAAHRETIANFAIEASEGGRLIAIDGRISPAIDDAKGGEWSADCDLVERQFTTDREASRLRLTLRCPAPPEVVILPVRADAASVTWQFGEQSVTRFAQTGIAGTTLVNPFAAGGHAIDPGRWTTFLDYVALGVWHVLEGWDHLAFVLCVALMFTSRRLLLALTLFTVGHSISLALSFLDVVRLPIAPVEAVIALTVVYMARAALVSRVWGGKVGVRDSHSDLLTIAAFGLIHGLGFASVLGQIGVPADHVVLSLAAFNIGVEIGQVLFVIGVLAVVGVAGALVGGRLATRTFTWSAGGAAGGVGLYWTVERALGLII